MQPSRVLCASVLAVGVFAASAAQAQENAQSLQAQIDQLRRDFETLKQQYDQRLTALETKLAAAPAQPEQTGAAVATSTPNNPAPPAPPEPAAGAAVSAPSQASAQVPTGAEGGGAPSGQLPVYGAATAGSKVFNPDMAVIGDFLGAAGHNSVQPDPFGLSDHPSPLQM